jgi:ABC-2 type transport system ATP-binding protein
LSVILTESLTKTYGARRGVQGINLAIPEGSLYGFLGPNGAGKTTTIRVLIGLLRPTDGRASIFGMDCWKQSARIKTEVGYIPGDLRLPSWLTGHSALHVFGAIRGRDLALSGKALAERLGLDLSVKVRSMSRGMRQKLGLILALAPRPRLLILDEPTTGLDPLMQEEFRRCLREMAVAGHTIFFSSHTLGEVEQLCDRVAIVRDGVIVADEALAALREKAGHEVTIEWKDATAAAAAPPPFLNVHQRTGLTWHCAITGPVDRLIAWLAGRPVADITIGRPDLESLFRRYYQRDEPAGHTEHHP